MQNLNIKYRLLVNYLFWRYKKSSENEKKTLKMISKLVIFRAFFFFSLPDPKSEKNPVNQLKQSGLGGFKGADDLILFYIRLALPYNKFGCNSMRSEIVTLHYKLKM